MKTVFPTFSQEGLTKLEFYSILILQGFCSNPSMKIQDNTIPSEVALSKSAIGLAKALIQELENDNK